MAPARPGGKPLLLLPQHSASRLPPRPARARANLVFLEERLAAGRKETRARGRDGSQQFSGLPHEEPAQGEADDRQLGLFPCPLPPSFSLRGSVKARSERDCARPTDHSVHSGRNRRSSRRRKRRPEGSYRERNSRRKSRRHERHFEADHSWEQRVKYTIRKKLAVRGREWVALVVSRILHLRSQWWW